MIVEVAGIYEHNKGALLMLEAVRERLAAEFPRVTLAVPTSMPRAYRRRWALLGVINPSGGRRDRIMSRLPTSVLRALGLVVRRDIDLLLDASGFGYGDFWGVNKLRRRLLGRLDTPYRNRGPTVLLPQALGPFDTPGIADVFREAVARLDRVYVRDAQSMRFVEGTNADPTKIRRAPDFTNLLHPALDERHKDLAGYRLIIPNEKMVGGGDMERRGRYIRFMGLASEYLAKGHQQVAILIHEGALDRALGDEINAALPAPLRIVDGLTALETKAIISFADVVVSSRFHGLVSALSNAVPALACGWSHKYAELMADYSSGHLVVSLDDEGKWHTLLAKLLEEASDPIYRQRLKAAAGVQKDASAAMWDDVISLIRLTCSPFSGR